MSLPGSIGCIMEANRVNILRADRLLRFVGGLLAEPKREITTRETRYENRRIKSRELGYIDENGIFILHGKRTYWDENGQKSFEEEFVDGMLQGIYREWHDNGGLQSEDVYIDGKLFGTSLVWDENGALIRRAEYRAGRLNGLVQEYGPEGNLLSEEFYDEDERHGRSVRYYEEGALSVEMDYVHGKLHGQTRMFMPDGAELLRATYDQGVLVSEHLDKKFARMLEKMASAPPPKRKPLP